LRLGQAKRAPQRDRELARVKAHNDEQVGQSVGWQSAAEVGHAEDARVEAVELLQSLSIDSLQPYWLK